MTGLLATCGHDDTLGYFTNTPCRPCMIAKAKADGFYPTPDPTPPF